MAALASIAAIVTLGWCFDYVQKRTAMPSIAAYHFIYKGYADRLAAKLADTIFTVKQRAVAQST
jgi:hypothetical protein